MFYEIPDNLRSEIDELEQLVKQFQRGDLEADALKARRVPFGCYEQRREGSYMLRVRATGGAVTPAQLRGMALISQRYGSDFIHITTRQEFQIHDLALESVIPAMRELLALGLSTRGGGGNTVRNIIVSPEAGIGHDEVFDPSPWAFALATRLIAEPDSWTLPRKFKISFSNSPSDTAFAQFNDLGFISRIQDGRQGFKVYVAGGLGSKSTVGHLLHDFVPATDAYVVAAALKRLFDKYGNRKNRNAARIRFLWAQLGEERFREIYSAEAETVRRLPNADLEPYTFLPHAESRHPQSWPDERSATAGYKQWKSRYVSAQRQEGLITVLVPAALGNIRSQHLIELAAFLQMFGPHSVRASFGQNLLVRNIPAAALPAAYQTVRQITELSDAPQLLAKAVSCTGADTCKLGICLPKGALAAMTERLRESALDLDRLTNFQINLSGCPNSCGQHSFADLGFYGQARRKGQQLYPAYGVVAGGVHADGVARLAQFIDTIAAHDLPEFTRDVLSVWLKKQYRYRSFAEYIDAEGKDEIKSICDRYRDVPEFYSDGSYYVDWGATQSFTLAGRGLGECSAGLFDLIGIDLKSIAELSRRLALALPQTERRDTLYRIALNSSRALLVTRGVAAPTDEEVLSSFQRHFISAGLIDSAFEPMIEAARLRDLAELERRESEVIELSRSVKDLYDRMDNSLRLPTEDIETHVRQRA